MSGSLWRIDEASWSSAWSDIRVRDKAAFSGALLACAVTLPPLPVAVAVLAVTTFCAIVLARVHTRLWWAVITLPAGFLTLSAIPLALGASIDPVGIFITRESLAQAAALIIRSTGAVSATLLFALTTPMGDVLASLRKAKLPDEIIDLSALTYRMIFSLVDSITAIWHAQYARLGNDTLRSKLTGAGATMSSVLLRSWHMSARLDVGLAGRGGDTLTVLPRQNRAAPHLYIAAVVGTVVLTASALLWMYLGLPTLGGGLW